MEAEFFAPGLVGVAREEGVGILQRQADGAADGVGIGLGMAHLSKAVLKAGHDGL